MRRPNMKITGAKIAQLRRSMGMCNYEFARLIEQPMWLIMLVENAHLDYNKELVDLLPDHVIETLLRDIKSAYGVSLRWLTNRCRSHKHPPMPTPEHPPLPILYLPITLTAEDMVYFIDDVRTCTLPAEDADIVAACICRQGMASMSMLHNLLLALQQKKGGEAWTAENREQLGHSLPVRLSTVEPYTNTAERSQHYTNAA